jgi:hypothetical protein
MLKRQRLTSSLVALILLLPPCSYPQANSKKKAMFHADLVYFRD